MKIQDQIIFEDLAEFLRENGIGSTISIRRNYLPVSGYKNDIHVIRICDVLYFILGCGIYYGLYSEPTEIVSLSDPQYREKFLERMTPPSFGLQIFK